MRSRRSNSGCSSCGSGGKTRARSPAAGSVRARQTSCGTVTVVDDSAETDPQPPGGGGGQGAEEGLSRSALLGGAAVAGLGIAYLSSRN